MQLGFCGCRSVTAPNITWRLGLLFLPLHQHAVAGVCAFQRAGARIHTHLWARAAAPGITVSMSLVDAANVSVAAAPWIPTATLSGKLSSSWEMLTLVSENTAKVAACNQPCHGVAVPHVKMQGGNMLTCVGMDSTGMCCKAACHCCCCCSCFKKHVPCHVPCKLKHHPVVVQAFVHAYM